LVVLLPMHPLALSASHLDIMDVRAKHHYELDYIPSGRPCALKSFHVCNYRQKPGLVGAQGNRHQGAAGLTRELTFVVLPLSRGAQR
jgi:hypothetical protein